MGTPSSYRHRRQRASLASLASLAGLVRSSVQVLQVLLEETNLRGKAGCFTLNSTLDGSVACHLTNALILLASRAPHVPEK